MTITIGSLFSGIGGLELGLERGLSRSGLQAKTVWQVEKNPYCRRVLAKHWPDAERYDDIKTIDTDCIPPVDLVCGGFPCQGISRANRGRVGVAGERLGLFFELMRIVGGLRPPFIVMENVSAITRPVRVSGVVTNPAPPYSRYRRVGRDRLFCMVGPSTRLHRWRPSPP